MRLAVLAFSFAVALGLVTASVAQDAVPPADLKALPLDDLAALKLRAAAEQDGVFLLNQLAAQVQQGFRINEVLGSLLGVGMDELQSDLRYNLADQVRAAQARAQRYADVLSNDLNGDGSVTRDEISDSLQFSQGRRGGAAEIFISFDADRNDILSPEEIRLAVQAVQVDKSRRNDNIAIARILDLDSDGTLSREEIARADAAVRLPEALQ